MDISSFSDIRKILEERGIKPQKTMGQNFLANKNILAKIIKASDLQENDIVLEIGPGMGTLTTELAKKCAKVIAVEKDRNMVEILQKILKDFGNVEIIQGDILKISNSQFLISKKISNEKPNYKIVANLPYYITSPVIRKFLESEHQPEFMVLMVQKEVAQRIVAKPPKMNLLAVSVQFYAQPEIVSYVSKNSFWPAPKVDSAIIKLQITKHKSQTNPKFFEVVKAGFSQPRKQLANNFAKTFEIKRELAEKWLTNCKISPTQRAQTVSIENWEKLVKSFPEKLQ